MRVKQQEEKVIYAESVNYKRTSDAYRKTDFMLRRFIGPIDKQLVNRDHQGQITDMKI